MDEAAVVEPLGVMGQLPAGDSLSRHRLIADEGVRFSQVFKHHIRTGFHGHPVHLLFLVQPLLQVLALGDVHQGALDDVVPILRPADDHVGAVQPVEGAVGEEGAVFPVLPVPHFMQQLVGLAQHGLVLLHHGAQHAAVPVL